jgi:16S rRNA (guanine527-N7)-methyltransferase
MAIVQPNAHFTLIEPMERRSDWLLMVVEQLGLKNVAVLRARAEEVAEVYDLVTARAVSALPKLLRLTAPLTRHGGAIIALKGGKAQEEVDEARKLSKKLGISGFELIHTGAQFLAEPTLVVRTTLV